MRYFEKSVTLDHMARKIRRLETSVIPLREPPNSFVWKVYLTKHH